MILLITGLCVAYVIFRLLKKVHTLGEDVSKLQQNVLDLEYRLQRGWANNSEKTKRLVHQLNRKEPLATHCVTFKKIDRKLYVSSPQMNLLTLSWEENIPVSSGCYGEGTCGQCAFVPVEGAENLSPRNEREETSLKMFNYPENARLSCQCRVNGNVTVELLNSLGSF